MERAEKAFVKKEKKPMGFAIMSIERRTEIARMGGEATARSGHGHRWNSEDAKAAGRKGGLAGKKKREEELERKLNESR